MTERAQEYLAKINPGSQPPLAKTDPDFVDRFASFAFDEVVNMPLTEGMEPIDDRTRFLAILATLLGCQGIDEFKIMLPAALNVDLTPVEVKEVVYQEVTYLGIGRVMPFLIGCGTCIRVCPRGCIRLEDGRPVYDYTNCMACSHACPKLAIKLACVKEPNPNARYRNPNITLGELILANRKN